MRATCKVRRQRPARGVNTPSARGRGWAAAGRIAIPVMVLGWLACTNHVPPTQPDLRVITGTWAGEHVVLVATEAGATVEYDCAHGSIDQPLRPDRSGRFEASGNHVFERPGPVSDTSAEDIHPARYSGDLTGVTMSLSVELPDRSETLGPFTLVKDSSPVLRKCL